MQVSDLKRLIQSNNIPNFLIFVGDEWKVQQVYIKQIATTKGLKIYPADDIESVWSKLTARSLFQDNYIYLLSNDKTLLTNEKVYSKITEVLSGNMIILTLSNYDKRLKMLKQYKDNIVEFEALNAQVLKQYLQKEIPLSDRNCEILMEVCDYNYGRCLLEIDKIKQFMRARETDDIYDHNLTDSEFKKLLEDGTIYVPPKDVLWDFIKAFLQNKPLKAYELYQNLKELETPVFSILSNLYNETKHVYQVQTCHSNDISKSTGLTGWQIRNAKECTGINYDEDLEYLMCLIQKVESGIKQGTMEELFAVDYIFINFM